jgi:hypothetical protein
MLRPTVKRPIRLGVGNPFFFPPIFCRTIALLFVLGRPLWREDVSVICSAICRGTVVLLLSQVRLLSYLFVASYDTQGLRWKYSNPLPHDRGEVRLLYDWRSAISMTRYRAPLWDSWKDITSCRNVAVWNLGSCQLMLFKKSIAVCCQKHMTQINAVCG